MTALERLFPGVDLLMFEQPVSFVEDLRADVAGKLLRLVVRHSDVGHESLAMREDFSALFCKRNNIL